MEQLIQTEAKQLICNYLEGKETLRNTQKNVQKITGNTFYLIRGKGKINALLKIN